MTLILSSLTGTEFLLAVKVRSTVIFCPNEMRPERINAIENRRVFFMGFSRKYEFHKNTASLKKTCRQCKKYL
jgi:hypothetical protein